MEYSTCGIYSFPKSGNTWMREIVRGIFRVETDISRVAPEMTNEDNQIPNWDILDAPDGSKWTFYKSHSAWELGGNNVVDLNNNLVIYILRNPLDVFCSQLNYLLKGFDQNRDRIKIPGKSIEELMLNGSLDIFYSVYLAFGTLTPLFWQASSWMENTKIWIEKSKTRDNILVVKYEDLIAEPIETLSKIFGRIGFNSASIKTAIELAESRTNDGNSFFWKKKAGNYLNYLSPDQIQLFETYHKESLMLTGYDLSFRQQKIM